MEYYQYNELPDTVKRYKYYTKSFQNWLVNTAVKRGLESARQLARQVSANSNKQITIFEQNRLIDEITRTRAPLTDTSGILDLSDAIRARKEVQYFHRLQGTVDENHEFFLHNVLEDARAKFLALSDLAPVIATAPKVNNEAINHIFNDASFSQMTDDEDISMLQNEGSILSMPDVTEKYVQDFQQVKSKERKGTAPQLSPDQIKLQEDYSIITLLYEVSRLRQHVRILWIDVAKKKLTAPAAALITDLALAYIQQKAAATAEDLGISDPFALEARIKNIHDRVMSPSAAALPPWLQKGSVTGLLCFKAFGILRCHKIAMDLKARNQETLSYPHKMFLQYFDVVSKGKLRLPLWDKFTCDMLRRPQSLWLPFGFRILLDIHTCMQEDLQKLPGGIIEQIMDLAEMVRTHSDYEDTTWNTDDRPEYMFHPAGQRIDDALIPTLDAMMAWLDKVLDTKEAANAPFTMSEFVAAHPVLGGLSMTYWLKQIQATSINKLNWVLTRFCHLYNAAKQVGDLSSDWKDLDFIIDMHGSQRIYVGEAPSVSAEFSNRYHLCTGISATYMATDYKQKGPNMPRASRAEKVGLTRGLTRKFPLDDKIRAFQTARDADDGWLKQHAIFNYLSKVNDDIDNPSRDHTEDAEINHIKNIFTFVASQMAPASDKKTKQQSSIKPPDFPGMKHEHLPLLSVMQSVIQSNELHSHFDYLSFFRGAFSVILRIRSEVLFSEAERINTVDRDPNPSNNALWDGLFRRFQHKASVKSKAKGKAQLKRIAEIMDEYIQHSGGVELERAKLRLNGDWETLKAQYPIPPQDTPQEVGEDVTTIVDGGEVLSEMAASTLVQPGDDAIVPGAEAKPAVVAKPRTVANDFSRPSSLSTDAPGQAPAPKSKPVAVAEVVPEVPVKTNPKVTIKAEGSPAFIFGGKGATTHDFHPRALPGRMESIKILQVPVGAPKRPFGEVTRNISKRAAHGRHLSVTAKVQSMTFDGSEDAKPPAQHTRSRSTVVPSAAKFTLDEGTVDSTKTVNDLETTITSRTADSSKLTSITPQPLGHSVTSNLELPQAPFQKPPLEKARSTSREIHSKAKLVTKPNHSRSKSSIMPPPLIPVTKHTHTRSKSSVAPPPVEKSLPEVGTNAPKDLVATSKPLSHTRNVSLQGSRIPLPVSKISKDTGLREKWAGYLAKNGTMGTATTDALASNENQQHQSSLRSSRRSTLDPIVISQFKQRSHVSTALVEEEILSLLKPVSKSQVTEDEPSKQCLVEAAMIIVACYIMYKLATSDPD